VIQPGARIGPYEIVSLLGEGGMGQVYRARDPRLDRDVALKIISSGKSVDAEQQRRFEQEARAAAALDHPNIIAVHDFGAHDGMPYIVSELLDGTTLRDRLTDGSLPPRKAIEYATQMARGLAAAHERKITHRDLKPENVFVLRDGRIKILDFGLAKLAGESGKAGLSQAVTADAGTAPGTVMGTVGYMSPEQVRGDTVDHRTDIFALGAILYEMLTGRRAFHGRTAADTMTAVLREDPAPIASSASAVQVPAALDRIVGYCLEKDANVRLQSAQDVAIALEAMSGSASVIEPPVTRRPPPWRVAAVAAIVGALTAVPAYFAGSSTARTSAVPEFARVTFQTVSSISGARFLPEQSGVIYSANTGRTRNQLFMTRLGSPESSALGGPGTRLAGISPNGELAVLRRPVQDAALRGATLARMPAAGGVPRDVLEGVEAADWAPDGANFAVVRTVDGRRRLEFPIGTSLFDTAGWIDAARVSPDGRRVAFAEHPIPSDDRGWVNVIDVASKRVQRLTGELSSLRGIVWHPVTREIHYGTDRRIEAVGSDGVVRVVARSTQGNYLHDIARDGRLLVDYSTFEIGMRVLLPSGEQRDLQWLDRTLPIAFWPSGDRLLFWETAQYSVYSRALDGSPAVRLGDGSGLALSPDGRHALATQHTDPMRLAIYPTGAGETRLLPTPGIQRIFGGAWTPNGAAVVFDAEEQGKEARLYKQRLTDSRPSPIGVSGLRLRFGTNPVSPDAAFVLATTPANELVLQPLDGGEARPAKGFRAGDFPLNWERDGRTLIVAESGPDWPVKLVRVNPISGARTAWRDDISFAGVPRAGTPLIVVSPDRQLIAISMPSGRSALYTVSFTAED
jgi:eukaryotic-like serine/threonine-protein kinase